ncbi:hypothetical protein [Domibacillus epiphyticus]|uniref:Uncharacterized protein n=1 Tax=Domibacillus epiphyticus TaxID=1714355 RepID=A0A1V2A6E6_9BACI|nr:hypothetical protein [Domibacillus epiphyticus]OMP66442.1 hypothetical protein BTO28_12120 [Domibacillus epiphyticus]
MAWYSYFLLNVPETLAMIGLTFILFGISIKENVKSIVTFSILYGAAAFSLNIGMSNSLKPFILLIIYSLLISIIFRYSFVNGLILSLVSFILLSFCEITFSVLYIHLFSLNYDDVLSHPWKRILASYCTAIIPMAVLGVVLNKLPIKIKFPLLAK